MSYSFRVRGTSKTEILERAFAELDKVVAGQPVHAADQAQAKAAVEAFVGILPDKTYGQDFSVMVNGSVGWSGNMVGQKITAASFGVSATLIGAEVKSDG